MFSQNLLSKILDSVKHFAIPFRESRILLSWYLYAC